MKPYRVEGGIARIGMGEVVGLTEEQIAPRAHRLTIMRTMEGYVACRADALLEFKIGEIVRLPASPQKGMAERLVPVDGSDDGRPRPKLEDRQRKEAAAKPARKPPKARKTAAPPRAAAERR